MSDMSRIDYEALGRKALRELEQVHAMWLEEDLGLFCECGGDVPCANEARERRAISRLIRAGIRLNALESAE